MNIDNQSEHYGQIAVQGPEAEEVMEQVLGLECKELAFYTFKTIETDGEQIIVSRTGYTGEDGFEVYGSHAFIQNAWDKLMESGKAKPCGLGCRDTLRFEVGLPLYGDELSADITPVMAGLSMFVKLDKEEFIGKEAIAKQKTEGASQKWLAFFCPHTRFHATDTKWWPKIRRLALSRRAISLFQPDKACAWLWWTRHTLCSGHRCKFASTANSTMER